GPACLSERSSLEYLRPGRLSIQGKRFRLTIRSTGKCFSIFFNRQSTNRNRSEAADKAAGFDVALHIPGVEDKVDRHGVVHGDEDLAGDSGYFDILFRDVDVASLCQLENVSHDGLILQKVGAGAARLGPQLGIQSLVSIVIRPQPDYCKYTNGQNKEEYQASYSAFPFLIFVVQAAPVHRAQSHPLVLCNETSSNY